MNISTACSSFVRLIIAYPLSLLLLSTFARPKQDDGWKMDRIPEIMDGKNVADYVDQDIDAKLALLEREEDQLQVG